MGERSVQPRKEEVRRLRLARGWTQEDLAAKVGCSKRTIEHVEGGHSVRISTLADLAEAFGSPVTVESLLASPSAAPQAVTASATTSALGNAPPMATLMIGRDPDLRELHARLSRATAGERPATQVLTAVRGWPGVGKTTLARALAHSPQMEASFPDGVLWASLGPQPSVLTELRTWARLLDDPEAVASATIEEMSERLAGLLRQRRMLLIVDDAWDASHAAPFLVGGRRCAMLVTTRLPAVADALAPTPDDSYRLDILSERESLELLATLAPDVVERHRAECRELVAALEGLPLALQVAGRLLRAEQHRVWGVAALLAGLRDDATRLLNARAPQDMAAEMGVSLTVAALLRKSTDHLDAVACKRFARLAPFAPRPASFDLEAMAAVWKVDEEEARRTVDVLVDRGLLEPLGKGEFQIHQVLVQHAKTLLKAGR